MGFLDGKVAVITGAGSGMAKASVKVFVREGAKVVAADISGAQDDTAAEVGSGVVPVHCDVTKEADVEAMIRAAVEQFGRVDAVLNVAGIAEGVMLTDVTMEHYDRTMDIDLRGVLLGMKHGIRAMLEAGTAARSSTGRRSAGSTRRRERASTRRPRRASSRITKTAAVEYGTQEHPGQRDLPRLHPDRDHGRIPRSDADGASDNTPLKRLGQPHEVAEVAAFLASGPRRSSRAPSSRSTVVAAC